MYSGTRPSSPHLTSHITAPTPTPTPTPCRSLLLLLIPALPSSFTIHSPLHPGPTCNPHVHCATSVADQPTRFQPTLQCMLHKLSPPLAFRCGAECGDTHLCPSLKTRRILSLIQPRSLAFIAWSTFHICHNERSKCIRHKERNKRNYCTRVQMYLSLSQPQSRSRSFAVIASSSFQTQVLMSGKRK